MVKWIQVKISDGAGGCTKGIPIPVGKADNRPETAAAALPKGARGTRQMTFMLEEATANKNGNLLALQQIAEVADGGRSAQEHIHPHLCQSSGLDEHVPTPKK